MHQAPLPARMRAALLLGHGGLEQLAVREVDVPRCGPGQALIEVRAAALNNTDINQRTGWYSRGADTAGTQAASAPQDGGWRGSALRFPRIQGVDACGIVVALGPDADPGLLGRRVLVDPILRHGAGEPAQYFGSDTDGAFAQYALVPAANAVRVECPLTDAELAALPCSYTAAEHMLTRARVRAGQRVLVTGASGGVGVAAVQLGVLRGAEVVAVASADKAVAIRALGATCVLGRDADPVAALGAESFDVVIDVVGGPAFPRLLALLRSGGCYAVAGAIGGPVVELDLRTLYLKDLRFEGCTIAPPGVFATLVSHVEAGRLRPRVAAVFALDQIARAQEEFLSKHHVGKIVLLPWGTERGP